MCLAFSWRQIVNKSLRFRKCCVLIRGNRGSDEESMYLVKTQLSINIRKLFQWMIPLRGVTTKEGRRVWPRYRLLGTCTNADSDFWITKRRNTLWTRLKSLSVLMAAWLEAPLRLTRGCPEAAQRLSRGCPGDVKRLPRGCPGCPYLSQRMPRACLENANALLAKKYVSICKNSN